jgi:hypothetical protein
MRGIEIALRGPDEIQPHPNESPGSVVLDRRRSPGAILVIDCGSLTDRNRTFDRLLQFSEISELCDDSTLNHEMIQLYPSAGWTAENKKRKIICNYKIIRS